MRTGSPSRILEPVDRCDIRMVERGQRLGLTFETRQAVRIVADALGQDFQGDVAIQAKVPRPVDLAHSPFAKKAGHFVAADAGAGLDRQMNRTAL